MECADSLRELYPFILGLVELNSAQELKTKHSACMAQAVGEHLAANSMLDLRQCLGINMPVLLTDSNRCEIVWTRQSDPNKVLCTRLPDISHALALLKHLLGTACAALDASRESGDDLIGESLASINAFSFCS